MKMLHGETIGHNFEQIGVAYIKEANKSQQDFKTTKRRIEHNNKNQTS